MRKHKNKIIAAVIIIAALTAAFIFGGRYSSPSRNAQPSAAPGAEPEPVSAATPPTEPSMVIDPETGKDKYLTDPVPEGKPLPIEPQDVTLGDAEYTCFLSVKCDTILDNMNLLDKEKHELVPDDGVILPLTEVTFYEGESVFNVLQREMKLNRIHLEFMNVPIYNSVYIEGINNLYEFDVGELSGWMYKVNGWFPNYGASRYQLQPGDVVEWLYTCDLGRDVGGWDSVNGYVVGADWLEEIGYEEDEE
ncbi:MAG: DUF4430 domain-containing protein [Oscillospiraceae bacterium]|jgi:hypothetical protein|nr:DUF4430 domain-containing protein [Oscillospiraceae bacterium]